ncbi:MAG: flagellar motor switch protein FliN [Candidatus Latescibacteria bacterium]|nr:flagellar motor switch protein FliN [Candidatus Latescibacterota bacterium]
MPDEANRGDKSEDELEAEMLRMMQQEASGTEPSEAALASESDNPEDEMMRMMQQAMAEAQAETLPSGGASNDMLEMEMLKAMQGDDAGSPAAPFPSFSAPVDTEGVTAGLSRILDVNVKITVELGSNQTPIKEILQWGEGTLVELERMDREPVDVLVNNKLFARGEVVVVGETFGIKITELLNGPTRK